MELYATDLHFLGDNSKMQAYDDCVHGKVVFKIDGCILSNDDSDWCLSASAYRFLRSLFENHFSRAEEHMIPCCGAFYASQDKTSVTVVGCSNGIDFDITHQDDNIIIRAQDGIAYTAPFEDYKAALTMLGIFLSANRRLLAKHSFQQQCILRSHFLPVPDQISVSL